MAEWTYGTILRRADDAGKRMFPHHRVMFITYNRFPGGPGAKGFTAVALEHAQEAGFTDRGFSADRWEEADADE